MSGAGLRGGGSRANGGLGGAGGAGRPGLVAEPGRQVDRRRDLVHHRGRRRSRLGSALRPGFERVGRWPASRRRARGPGQAPGPGSRDRSRRRLVLIPRPGGPRAEAGRRGGGGIRSRDILPPSAPAADRPAATGAGVIAARGGSSGPGFFGERPRRTAFGRPIVISSCWGSSRCGPMMCLGLLFEPRCEADDGGVHPCRGSPRDLAPRCRPEADRSVGVPPSMSLGVGSDRDGSRRGPRPDAPSRCVHRACETAPGPIAAGGRGVRRAKPRAGSGRSGPGPSPGSWWLSPSPAPDGRPRRAGWPWRLRRGATGLPGLRRGTAAGAGRHRPGT